MGMEPFEQIGNTLLTEGLIGNLVKIAQTVTEKKTFKNNIILYMYIAQGQGQITIWGQNFDSTTKMFYYFNSYIVSFSH